MASYDRYEEDRGGNQYRVRTIVKEPHYMGAWGYFWLRILYLIPIVGFVFLIVHACMTNNRCRCSFARSYFCILLVAAIIILTIVVITLILGSSMSGSLSDIFSNTFDF